MFDKILKDSMDRKWTVTIIYQSGEKITLRNIEVKSINGNIVQAYCHLRHQARVFNVDKILAADYCRRA